jgi:hypothetical protein
MPQTVALEVVPVLVGGLAHQVVPPVLVGVLPLQLLQVLFQPPPQRQAEMHRTRPMWPGWHEPHLDLLTSVSASPDLHSKTAQPALWSGPHLVSLKKQG